MGEVEESHRGRRFDVDMVNSAACQLRGWFAGDSYSLLPLISTFLLLCEVKVKSKSKPKPKNGDSRLKCSVVVVNFPTPY